VRAQVGLDFILHHDLFKLIRSRLDLVMLATTSRGHVHHAFTTHTTKASRVPSSDLLAFLRHQLDHFYREEESGNDVATRPKRISLRRTVGRSPRAMETAKRSIHTARASRLEAVALSRNISAFEDDRDELGSPESLFSSIESLLSPAPSTHSDSEKASISQRLSDIYDTALSVEALSDPKLCSKLAEAMTLHGRPRDAKHILRTCHKQGGSLTPTLYEPMAYRLLVREEWKEIVDLTNMVKRYTGRTSVRLLNWKFRAWAELGNFALLSDALSIFTNESLRPDRKTFNTLIHAHLRNNDALAAESVLSTMESSGIPFDQSTYISILSGWRAMGGDINTEKHIFDLLGIDGERRTDVVNAVVEVMLDRGDAAGATRALQSFQASPEDDSTTPNPDNAANVRIYTTLLNFCVRTKDLSRAQQLFDELVRKPDLELSVDAVAAYIRVHLAVGKVDEAVGIVTLLDADDMGISLDSKTFIRRMGTRPPTAEDIESTRFLQAITPNTFIFNTLLSTALSTHGLPGFLNTLRYMHSRSIAPDARTVQILLSYLDSETRLRPRQLVKVLKYLTLRQPTATTKSRIRPTVDHLNIILRSAIRRERWCTPARRSALYRNPVSAHHSVYIAQPLSTSSAASPTSGLSPTHKDLKPLIQSILARRLKSNTVTHALHLQQSPNPNETFSHLLASRITPTAYHYASLMSFYADQGDMEQAVRIFKTALAAGIMATVAMFTILIVGYGKLAQPEKASSLFIDMQASGVKPDIASIDALASAHRNAGNWDEARNVILRYWGNVAPFKENLKDLTLKGLFYALRTLGGAQRKGGRRPVSIARKKITKGLVTQILKSWGGDVEKRSINIGRGKGAAKRKGDVGKGDVLTEVAANN
jgi:pentatricopeptide repeat protein